MTRPYEPYDPSSGSGDQQGNAGGAQPGWQPPQHPQQQPPYYGPPQQYGPPPQPQWQQQPYGPPPGAGWGPTEELMPAQQPPNGRGGGGGGGRGKLIAATAAAVVVIGGGVATYAAVSSSDAGSGASTPKAAVQKMLGDVDNADLLGAMNDLAPNERAAIVTPVTEAIDKLKKNDIVKQNVNLSHVPGITFKLTDPTYAAQTVTINDHTQAVQLTGGTLTVSGSAANAPFTSDLLRAVHASSSGKTQKVDIATQVRRLGKPIMLVATKSGDTWYPSLFYTIAQNATLQSGHQTPTAAQRIPDVGGSSPDDAVRTMINALIAGNAKRAIELTSPDEMAVLHDYGQVLVEQSHFGTSNSPVHDLQFTDTPITGGTRVSLKSLQFDVDGQTAKLSINGSCITFEVQGTTKKQCAADALGGFLGAGNTGALFGDLTTRQKQALNDFFSGITNIGLDVTQTNGQYYINPVRSFLDLSNELLSGLKPGDGQVLLHLSGK